MQSQAIELFMRAWVMLAYIVGWVWSSNRAFPSNWLALGVLFVALIPVALFYRWLTDPRPNPGDTQIDSVLYSERL